MPMEKNNKWGDFHVCEVIFNTPSTMSNTHRRCSINVSTFLFPISIINLMRKHFFPMLYNHKYLIS